jgi:parallel beta-helix repeat protein
MQILSNEVIGARDGIAVQKMGSGMACNYLISGNVVKNNVNGFWIQLTGSKILKNTATSNKVSGLDITGSYNTIEYNTATGNDNCGISLGRYSSADHNLVSHNVLSYNIAGINSASRGSTISYNTVTFNKNNGIISVANNVTIVGNIINNTARRIIAEGTDVTCQS